VCSRGNRTEAAGKIFGRPEESAQELNEAYIKYTHTGLPFVIGKFAMSLDGKIATKTGESRWISGEQSRRYVHTLRSQIDAIMVGVDTVLGRPQLTSGRSGGGEKQP
jgi:diaminohydroxyphosphoribosylaminopyrimidine deaminase/5-amino-6-(5-phosphoribosylamino)uracil reductase